MMNQQQQDEFWRLYEAKARKALEGACVRASRSLSGGSMDVCDMIAWIDDRVWRMLKLEQAPLFHEQVTPQEAVERVLAHSKTLSRWAYLALSRRHWKRLERSQEFVAQTSRAERLAYVKAAEVDIEKQEEIDEKLAKIRSTVSQNVRRRAAASWQDLAERHRIAAALGATEKEDTDLIEQTISGEIKINTVEQMRSRSIRRIREIVAEHASKALVLMAVVSALVAAVPAHAGEQSGGRGGGSAAAEIQVLDHHALRAGEQSGGRGGRG